MEKNQLLLDQAGFFVQESKAKMAANGEAFNIFTITNTERAEVATHSAMIAELLNPNGSHGMGARFLALFLTAVEIEYDCTLTNAQVRKEQTFSGGKSRVDIVIHLRDHLILIENKVDAEDGNWQLKNYADIGSATGKTWHLLYLTKKGTDAHERSHRGALYQRVSYCEHILNWLDMCVSSSAGTLALQHALIQYRNLVKKITGQAMTHTTRNSLIDLLSQGDNLKSADAIADALPYAKGALLFRFFLAVQQALSKSHARATPPNGFSGLEFSEENCNKWFLARRFRVKHVGLFFDIGVDGMLFRIEVATDALHYGVVPVKDGQLGSLSDLIESGPQIPTHLITRAWKAFSWQSCLYKDNVAIDMECLLSPDEVLNRVAQTIKQLKSGLMAAEVRPLSK